jgi:hypothetical protein
MSSVTNMIVTCDLIEEDDDGGLGAFHAWCTHLDRPIRFDAVPDDLGVNHSKGTEVHILVAAGNYFDHDALATAFPTFPWMFPQNAVLVIHLQDGHPTIVRGDGPVRPLDELAEGWMRKAGELPDESAYGDALWRCAFDLRHELTR